MQLNESVTAFYEGRRLSVSSNGSWCVQRRQTRGAGEQDNDFQYPRTDRGVCNTPPAAQCARYLRSFSILERIVVCATRDSRVRAGCVICLSVSSNGSWCVQPRPSSKSEISQGNFQYPRTDRGVCNPAELFARRRTPRTFSILERIVVCATCECC